MNQMNVQATQPRTLNPQMIDEIAAQVFWGFCYQTSHQSAVSFVLKDDYGKLWTLQKAAELLRPFADGKVARETVEQCYRQTNQYMRDNTAQNKNIIGTVYAEDFRRCRRPGFPYEELVQRLGMAGDGVEGSVRGSVEIAGDLLLRTPLPSLVLLRALPGDNGIQVSDTRQALGFQKTMLLLIHNLSALPANPQGYIYSAEGVFQIPCPDSARSGWIKLIPNGNACGKIVLF
jgi:hypothetical protein